MQYLQDLRGKEASLGFLGLPLGVPCPKVFLVGDSLRRGLSADHRVVCGPPSRPLLREGARERPR